MRRLTIAAALLAMLAGCAAVDGLVQNTRGRITMVEGLRQYDAGNHEAAQRNAMMYTFITACKHNGVDPSEWLQDVLTRMHSQSIQKLDPLFPQNWKPEAKGV